jgi:hypothetical protein
MRTERRDHDDRIDDVRGLPVDRAVGDSLLVAT